MKKRSYITLGIILAVILFAYFTLNKTSPEIDKEVAQCIGENSLLYVQLGCSHCEDQEKMFGDNYQYLNVIDCFFELEKCGEITATPTWVIKGQKYSGVQKIDKLRELTGC